VNHKAYYKAGQSDQSDVQWISSVIINSDRIDPYRTSTSVPGQLCTDCNYQWSQTLAVICNSWLCQINYKNEVQWMQLQLFWSSSMELSTTRPHRQTITETDTFKRHLKSFLFTNSFSIDLLAHLDKLFKSTIQDTDCICMCIDVRQLGPELMLTMVTPCSVDDQWPLASWI